MFMRKNKKSTTIEIDGLSIQITRKKVKNINLRMYPSKQEIRISAPHYIREQAIRNFAISKLGWIRRKLANYKAPVHPNGPDFITGETHFYKGNPLTLRVSTRNAAPEIILHREQDILEMYVRPGSSKEKRATVLKEWYRARLKEQIPKIIEKWEEPMGVSVAEFGVKKMKTRWGSCNTRARRIWLNLELAKKSPACLEYVVVHEMVHLLERLHNERFYRLMEQFLPSWQEIEKELQGKVD